MIQRYTLFSQEEPDFVLEIMIDADSNFLHLQQVILEACGYADQQAHQFFICDEDWRVGQKVHQQEPENTYTDEDVYLMEETLLSEFMEEEAQHLAFVFDTEEKRVFLMELTENIFGQTIQEAYVSRRHGTAPQQMQVEEEELSTTKSQISTEEIEEDFYGDELHAEDELDAEGFEIDE